MQPEMRGTGAAVLVELIQRALQGDDSNRRRLPSKEVSYNGDVDGLWRLLPKALLLTSTTSLFMLILQGGGTGNEPEPDML